MDTADLMDLALSSQPPETLAALTATAELTRLVERRQAMLVHCARNEGITWAQIAQALGVTKQAVHRKYGGRGLLGEHP